MQRDYHIAALVIEDANKEDFTDYNCTVQNAYGSAMVSIHLEGKGKHVTFPYD